MVFTKSKIFIAVCSSFAVGILIGSLFNIAHQVIYFVLTVCLVAYGISFFLKNKVVALSAVFLLSAVLGVLRIQSSLHESGFTTLFDSKQQLEGYIVEDIDIRTDKQ